MLFRRRDHEAIVAGHHQLLRYATQKALIDTPRTTIVACLMQGNAAYWAHCGDSRLYMVRGDKLIGGRGTLTTPTAIKTVESYWPYATTLFDFVKRAMPMPAPGSLSDNQVYAVVAYILAEAKIIDTSAVLDATTLPKVAMPNRDGFVGDPRPEIELYR